MEDSSKLVEWRLQTIKCAAIIGRSDAERAVCQLNEFLSRLVVNRDRASQDPKDKLSIHDRLLRLCQESLDFGLVARRCRDSYRCEYPQVGNRLNEEDESEQDWEGERGEPWKISFVIAPALVKYSEHDRNRRVVLEKAQVLVRRDSRSSEGFQGYRDAGTPWEQIL